MAEHAPVLIVLSPLLGAILVMLTVRLGAGAAWVISLLATAASAAAAIATLRQVLEASDGVIRYQLGGWAPPMGIEYRVDAINSLVTIVIAVIGFLSILYTRSCATIETPSKQPQFYALLLLLMAGLAGVTLTNDAFNLYVLIEICSLTSYGLIAMGSRRAVLASFNYVIIGTIGASFYLLGVGYLYIKTGSLNMEDIRGMIAANETLASSATIEVAFVLMMLGVWMKMALFPLHGWLPNAYAYSPTGTSAFMAPMVTKVMVYVMVRVMLGVFGVDYIFSSNWASVASALATIAIVAGSVLALSRRDIRRMLGYLIVAEVGYMVGGAWTATQAGMTGAIYHILSDAAMTFCLFLAVGIIIHRTGKHRLDAFDGLFHKMPLTMTLFTIGGLSMIGLPPTCGFISKWYLVQGGIEAGQWHYVIALLLSSLVNAILFFRIFERAFFRDIKHESLERFYDPEKSATVLEKVPLSMFISAVIAAASLFVIGIYNHTLTTWIRAALANLNL